MAQATSSSIGPTNPPEDDWSHITDRAERKKIQNRNAQRKHREKNRLRREQAERDAENQRQAGGSYSAPDPDDINDHDESGLPWGSFSFSHSIAAGKAKEASSHETSPANTASHNGVGSR